jgi:hypothetical protein
MVGGVLDYLGTRPTKSVYGEDWSADL